MASVSADRSDPPIRDAATLILTREADTGAEVLMGRRGERAAFMPMKFVFPGGAVDQDDADIALATPLRPDCRARLAAHGTRATPEALAAAAIRELWEEAGLILGAPGAWADAPPDWQAFAATGHRPAAAGLSFIFRAITPPRRPRRFDARFFLADAGHIAGDLDDFSRATDELSQMQWVPLADARHFDLPFITQVVLAEVSAHLRGRPHTNVPFFKNDTETSEFIRL